MQWRTRLASASLLSRQALAGYAVTVVAVAVLTAMLSPLRLRLGLLNIGLLFLLFVVLIAARWGWGPGLFASVVANLVFNFFFVPPLHTFTVGAPQNVLGLSVFLGVAALTSALLSRARAGEAAARRRAEETAILYDLSRLIIVSPSTTATLTSLCQRVRDTFGVESCAVLLPGPGGLKPVASSGPLERMPITAYERHGAEQAYATGTTVYVGGAGGRRRPRIVGIKDRPIPAVFVPLSIGRNTAGVMQIGGQLQARVFTEDERRLLEAFADEVALAVDRDRLLHEAARAEALQETDRLKSALLSAVSHDLRTPLTAILTAASSLLQEDVQWDEAARREFLTSIESQALRLSRLVSNLLDLSRIEGGALRPDKDWYDVREMLESAIEGSARVLTAHRVALDVEPDVGEAHFDHVQITQVVTNLLENAAKFAPAGTTISVGARRADGSLELSVADQGPGIPPEEREQVFEKFYRLSRTQRTPGTGIGLAIVKGLVEAHDGRIRVEDAPGGGARFVVRLPLGGPSAPAVPVATPAAAEPPPPEAPSPEPGERRRSPSSVRRHRGRSAP
jgi:two-component system sensor histidine kinase KdpD